MVAKNDITGDSIQTKTTSDSYRDNYDLIFRSGKVVSKSQAKRLAAMGYVDNTGVTVNEYQDILSTEDAIVGITTNEKEI